MILTIRGGLPQVIGQKRLTKPFLSRVRAFLLNAIKWIDEHRQLVTPCFS